MSQQILLQVLSSAGSAAGHKRRRSAPYFLLLVVHASLTPEGSCVLDGNVQVASVARAASGETRRIEKGGQELVSYERRDVCRLIVQSAVGRRRRRVGECRR